MNDGDVLPILPNGDTRSEARYEHSEADAQDEAAKDRRLEGRLSDSEGIEPW